MCSQAIFKAFLIFLYLKITSIIPTTDIISELKIISAPEFFNSCCPIAEKLIFGLSFLCSFT